MRDGKVLLLKFGCTGSGVHHERAEFVGNTEWMIWRWKRGYFLVFSDLFCWTRWATDLEFVGINDGLGDCGTSQWSGC